jgi:hypothetical protein
LYIKYKINKKLGEKMQGIIFFFTWHVRYCLYFT